ncbi:unnamed protein product [Brassicogethes aeneus]|uniref:Uncharacterized protein n=1 Tax=Brassicogethes aeneus TaxID=1431903 RepID=A0A9P0FNZ9_BRAAE|nr:unnamed protein product [Brassicogethes aeneus]
MHHCVTTITILFVFYFNAVCEGITFNHELDEYLSKQSIALEAEEYKRIKKWDENEKLIVLFENNAQLSNEPNNIIQSVSAYNHTCILLKNSIQCVPKSDNLKSKTINNADILSNIYSMQSYQHKGTAYASIVYKNNTMILYSLTTEFGFEYLQSISFHNISDVKFFKEQNELYLMVATKLEKDEVHGYLILYKYSGSYFDETLKILTKPVLKIKALDNSGIIVTLDDQNYVSTYELNYGQIKKLQKIQNEHPVNIVTYNTKSKKYLAIFEQSGYHSIYYWKDDYFRLLQNFYFDSKVISSTIINHKNTPYMILFGAKYITVLNLNKNKFVSQETYKDYITHVHYIQFSDQILNDGFVIYRDNAVQFKLSKISLSMQIDAEDGLSDIQSCFAQLKNSLNFKVYGKNSKFVESLPTFNQTQSEAAFGNVVSQELRGDNPESIITEVDSVLNNLKSKLLFLRETIDNYNQVQDNHLVVKGDAIIKNIKVNTLKGDDVNFGIVNDLEWSPEHWLQYNTEQLITGQFSVNNLTVKHLNVNPVPDIFKDMLVKNSNEKLVIDVPVALQHLTVNKMISNVINDINISDIYNKNSNEAVKGVKIFDNLNVHEAKIKHLNNDVPDGILSNFANSKLNNFDRMVEIENLWVDEIDQINWDAFSKSVFRVGKTDTIEGDLTLTKFLTDRLKLKKLNGKPIDDLLTTSTDQTVKSTVIFKNIFTQKSTVEKINDVPFDNFVFLKENVKPTIKGIVKIDKAVVNEKLELIGDFADVYMKEGAHIIGTNESDLLQVYNDEVHIKGDLYVSNLDIWDDTKLILSNENFNLDFKKYWNKSAEHQVIDVHVEALRGMTTSSLRTNLINNRNINQFMRNTDQPQAKTNFHFENITIAGNLILDDNQMHTPDLKKIDADGVKTTGSFNIKGKKTFIDTVRAEKLNTNYLGGIDMLDVVNRNQKVSITGRKVFGNVTIRENLIGKNLELGKINDKDVSGIFEDAYFLDKPGDMSNLNFEDVTVNNLNTERINGHNINDHIKKMETMYATTKIKDIFIIGNLTINSLDNVDKINDIDFEDLIKNETATKVITNVVNFTETITVDNLIVKVINDVDFEILTSRIFYKGGDQEITAPYTFENLKANNIFVNKINNISFDDMVDTDGILYISTDLNIKKAHMESLQAQKVLPCDLADVMKYANSPNPNLWMNVNVSGNATFLDDTCDISRILLKTVKNNGVNFIEEEVNINAHLAAENIDIKNGFINDIDVEEILDDVVLKSSDDIQYISGRKVFPQAFISSGAVRGNADVPVINNILLSELDRRMIRKDFIESDVITGRKTFFGGLQTKKIVCNIISNIPPENIATFTKELVVPNTIFEAIEVDNMTVENVNNHNLKKVLENKLLQNSEEKQFTNATYFFESIDINENLITPFINDVMIDNMVVDEGIQNIRSPKTFRKKITIVGNTQMDYIDGYHLSETYEKLILFSEPARIKGSITLQSPNEMMGSIQAKSINGHSVEYINDILSMQSTNLRVSSVYTNKNEINRNVDRMLNLTQNLPSDLLYIETSKILDVQAPNIIDSKSAESAGHVLIHLTSEEDGHFCGLPDHCKCPTQQSIEITPTHSINTFFNKAVQRTYTYDDDDMILNVITNSISSDADCRRDVTTALQEVTSVTWSTKSSAHRNGSFHIFNEFITGYVSGVEFFTIEGITYAVIGIYYDPVLDSHDVTSRVIRFDEDKSDGTTIQWLPSRGLKTLYLFHTAQGIILIMGNFEETEIYRFDMENQQFVLLRTIPSYGCSAATGVVLSRDSLIVLAHDTAPIVVLKYNPVYDNYHYYQSFHMDGPVSGISVFYTGGFGISDAYLCIVSENDRYFIYSFQFIAGWRLEWNGEMDGLKKLIPFDISNQSYLLAPTSKLSTLFAVVKHGLK